MNKKEFGQLISALRKEQKDENDHQYTQAKLAEVTGVSEIVIGKIERGERENFESDLLFRLAKAFHLSSRERKEFFAAAISIDGQGSIPEITSSKQVFDDLIEMMRQIQLPAFIVDGYADIMVSNAMLEHLLLIPQKTILTIPFELAGRNMLRILFAPDSNHYKLIGEENYDVYALKVLRFVKAISLQYRATPYWQNNIFAGARKYPVSPQ
jgi:transcriptional regulator with XRE-family HTH domain